MKKSLIGQTFYLLRNSSFDGGVEGNEIQLNTFKLFLLKAFNERHPNFYVWMDDKGAGKYDDVLYSCEKDGKTKFTFLQLKHKIYPLPLDFTALFDNEDYDLYKYLCPICIQTQFPFSHSNPPTRRNEKLIHDNFNTFALKNCKKFGI